MRRLLVPALSALLLAMLAACESASSGGALDIALDAPRRCTHCGWIESKQEIRPSTADPHTLVIYEYTVRMANGSSRVFREELPVSWRLRERLIFIDGAGAPDGLIKSLSDKNRQNAAPPKGPALPEAAGHTPS